MALGNAGSGGGTKRQYGSGTQWPTGDPLFATSERAFDGPSRRDPMHIGGGQMDYRTWIETLLNGGTETGDRGWDY